MGWTTWRRAPAELSFCISKTRWDDAASGRWLTLNAADLKYHKTVMTSVVMTAYSGITYDGQPLVAVFTTDGLFQSNRILLRTKVMF